MREFAVFGGILAKKPKPYRSILCVTAAFLGWSLVRDKILPKFGSCKSHEFVSVLYLLDHVVPTVFFQYQAFRSGYLNEFILLASPTHKNKYINKDINDSN